MENAIPCKLSPIIFEAAQVNIIRIICTDNLNDYSMFIVMFIASVYYIILIIQRHSLFQSLHQKYLNFVRVHFLTKLSKSLPPKLVGFDENWPQTSRSFVQAGDLLKEMHRSNLARRFMKRLTPEDKSQVFYVPLCFACSIKQYSLLA